MIREKLVLKITGGNRMTVALARVLAVAWIFAAASGASAEEGGRGVKIGIMSDVNGPAASNSGTGSTLAAKMAIEDFGENVLGKPVETVTADFQLKVDIGSAIIRRWFDEENVDAITDVPSSPLALAVQNLVKDKNKIFLMSGPTSSDLTGKACSPNAVAFHMDSYALGNIVAREVVRRGGDKWFFLTTDTAFGHALERDTTTALVAAGGNVAGTVRSPLNNQDFSSALLTASSSGANIIALVSTSTDTSNALKQAREFGLMEAKRGISFTAPLGNLHDFHAVGLETAQGVITSDGFDWNKNDATRQFSDRFFKRANSMPSAIHAATYSAVLHYLKAVRSAGTKDTATVMKVMKSTPVEDFFAGKGWIREDGRMISDRYLLQVKKPDESRSEWDIYNLLKIIPGDQVFRPLTEGGCPFVAAAK
jgi:branched-chain amino acid transport system substrate-binding protein